MKGILNHGFRAGIVSLFCVAAAFGQAPGSSNTENSTRYVGGIRETDGETLYIGPDADMTIEGTWHIYSKYVWISPLATISGGGTIIFHNSADVGGAGGPTVIDGNNNKFIDVNIVHDNNSGMEIKNVALDASLASAGWANNTAESTLKIGKDFNQRVDGADVTLDATTGVTGDFVFDSDATISGYRPNRMVITNNSIQSHMVKQDASAGFVFPIGISDGNYTPAKVTGSGTYHASVQDYTASTSNETLLQGGPERTWHVYADEASTATVALQHYVASDSAPFSSSENHYVTQYQGTSWSVSTEKPGLPGTLTTNTVNNPVSGSSLQDLAGVAIPASGAGNGSYLTKTNTKALPVTLVSFSVVREADAASISWSTSVETRADRFEIERSADAKTWVWIGERAAVGESRQISRYNFTDRSPASGTNYYRLKMIDLDGTYTYSRIQSLAFDASALRLVIYPNPADNYLLVQDATGRALSPEDVKEVSVTDIRGVTVLKSSRPVSSAGLDVRHLAAGIYVVVITLPDGTLSTHKVVLSK